MRYISSLKLLLASAAILVQGQLAPPVAGEQGVSAHAFDISEVTLNGGRWHDNQDRTQTYLKFVDLDRLLYVYRTNHKLSTKGAEPDGGWDAPSFPFRSHIQGHFLTGWAQCYSQTKDAECKNRATTFVAELLKCQNNNAAAGFSAGFLSGFPEADITAVEDGTLTNGNVPYYVVHKLMAGLLDVWRALNDQTAQTVLLNLAKWVDARTAKLSYSKMQAMLQTEFGGMPEVLADLYYQTGDRKWLDVAQRFHHAAVLTPLANNQDQLDGLHANTQVPKWIGAARLYKATGNQTYLNIARNSWKITTDAHTYAIGGNSQAEHFRKPNAIAAYLTADSAESCNSYNMLKLTRELWVMDPANTAYFDYYERTITNQMIGQQNPKDSHGHVTYFSSLDPGGVRGIGPAWGGGTWSTDYDSMWCCQGTGMETNTKLMDSVFFHDDSSLYVNLFAPAVVRWGQKNVVVTQTTTFPVSDTTLLQVKGGGSWAMKIRIPAWTSNAIITINGKSAGVSTAPGQYASISRTWSAGDTVSVKLPMNFRLLPANDNKSIAALAYGPVVLAANYGTTAPTTNPSLALPSVKRTSSSSLAFEATANGAKVNLVPFYDAQGFKYVAYWAVSGSLPSL